MRPSDLKHKNSIYIQSLNTVGDSIDLKIGEKENEKDSKILPASTKTSSTCLKI